MTRRAPRGAVAESFMSGASLLERAPTASARFTFRYRQPLERRDAANRFESGAVAVCLTSQQPA